LQTNRSHEVKKVQNFRFLPVVVITKYPNRNLWTSIVERLEYLLPIPSFLEVKLCFVNSRCLRFSLSRLVPRLLSRAPIDRFSSPESPLTRLTSHSSTPERSGW